MFNAKRMRAVAERVLKERHEDWLDSIESAIYKTANDGRFAYDARCKNSQEVNELMDIYSNLGYKVTETRDCVGNYYATIEW